MKIVVLNGSPKGMTSVTMQYVLFLQKKLPQHQFTILNVCQELKKLEGDPKAFQKVLDAVAGADGVLWAFPLYYMLVHANYKRFIELIFERGGEHAFQGKYAATLTTSIHFFDHTAHEYVHAVCDDLGMKYVGMYAAAMNDLLDVEQQHKLLLFADEFLRAMERRIVVPRQFPPVVQNIRDYAPGASPTAIDPQGRRVVIVTDADSPTGNLANMVGRLQASFQGKAAVVNLHDIVMKGACLGCCQCGLDNTCVLKDADDVFATYQKLMAADVLIFAATIRDRYISALWKQFIDRSFFMNHVPIYAGKQIAWLIAGPLGQLATCRQVLEAYVECQSANLVGMVSDECDDSPELDRQLDSLASRLIDAAAAGYVPPPTFLSVAGQKLFRDSVWSELRIVFRRDHAYYKQHGLYDFPRRSLKTRLFEGVLSILFLIPAFRRAFRKRIKEEMVKPLQKLVDKA